MFGLSRLSRHCFADSVFEISALLTMKIRQLSAWHKHCVSWPITVLVCACAHLQHVWTHIYADQSPCETHPHVHVAGICIFCRLGHLSPLNSEAFYSFEMNTKFGYILIHQVNSSRFLTWDKGIAGEISSGCSDRLRLTEKFLDFRSLILAPLTEAHVIFILLEFSWHARVYIIWLLCTIMNSRIYSIPPKWTFSFWVEYHICVSYI